MTDITDEEIRSTTPEKARRAACLFGRFDWEDTPPGEAYWVDLYDRLLERANEQR